MPRPDEGLIHTWLDGQLSPDEAARIEQLVATDAEWAAAAAEARGLIAASSRIISALDHVPAGVIPKGTASTRVRRLPWWTKAAAAVVLVAGMGTVLLRNDAVVQTMPGRAGGTAPLATTVREKDGAARPVDATKLANSPAAAVAEAPAQGKVSKEAPVVPRAVRSVAAPPPKADLAMAEVRAASAATDASARRDVQRRDAPPAAAERAVSEELTVHALAAKAAPTAEANAVPAPAPVAAVQVLGGVAAQARKAGVAPATACYRLQESGPPTAQVIVMRHVRTDGDTLRLEPLAGLSASPVRAWLVLRDGVARGAMTMAPGSRNTVPVTATPTNCPAP